MTARESYVGNIRTRAPLLTPRARRNLEIPAGSLRSTADYPLPSPKFFQPMLDILAVAAAVVFAISGGVAITVALFLLLFVKT